MAGGAARGRSRRHGGILRWWSLLAAALFSSGALATSAVAGRRLLTEDAVYRVSPSKAAPWNDPQSALNWVTGNIDFGGHRVTIELDADVVWAPPREGYQCSGRHVGAGILALEGADGKTATIDGSINQGSAFSALEDCEILLRNISLKSGAGGNSVSVYLGGRVYFGDILWAGAVNADIFVSRSGYVEQIGRDAIAAAATNHVVASHHGEFRNSGQMTTVLTDLAYGMREKSFAYAEGLADIIYTDRPSFVLGDHKVTGQRCYAENIALIQQRTLGDAFFPGDVACSALGGGQLQQ